MTIQSIGTGSAVLYITAADLKERGLTPAQLTLEEALELLLSGATEVTEDEGGTAGEDTGL